MVEYLPLGEFSYRVSFVSNKGWTFTRNRQEEETVEGRCKELIVMTDYGL